jgi:hypothetical protein
MDPLCIICLTSLPSAEASLGEGNLPEQRADDISLENGEAPSPAQVDVAHLQNCRHTFHDHCLAVWTEVFSLQRMDC